MARGKDPDLRHEPDGQRRRRGEVRARLGIRTAAHRLDEQESEGADRDDAREDERVLGVVEDEAQRVHDGVMRLPRRLVAAQDLAERSTVA